MENFELEEVKKGELNPGDVVVSVEPVKFLFGSVCTSFKHYKFHTVKTVSPKQTIVTMESGLKAKCTGDDIFYSIPGGYICKPGNLIPEQILVYNKAVTAVSQLYRIFNGRLSLKKLHDAPVHEILRIYESVRQIHNEVYDKFKDEEQR